MKELLIIAILLNGTTIPMRTQVMEDCQEWVNHPIIVESYKEVYGPDTIFYCQVEGDTKVVEARITGYYREPGSLGALGTPIRAGGTVAVSRNCKFLLGSKVHIDQHGVFEANDTTADWLHEKFEGCTVDIAKPSLEEARAVGSKKRTVTRLPSN